ncbi:MAG: hypothetical protein AUJ57_05780 [Zetaproteobacteria bacterium CG1_02_53_45]|nr:MAG: hypothetical protein AUJ57_05780 [Zetaproteobacteria bacterium CG1_02_53_45]
MTLEFFLTLIIVIIAVILLIRFIAWLAVQRNKRAGDSSTSGSASAFTTSSPTSGKCTADAHASDSGCGSSDGGGGD